MGKYYHIEFTEREVKEAIENCIIAITCGLVISLLIFLLFLFTVSRFASPGRGWAQDVVDGAITMFASVSTDLFTALILGCTPSFLDYFSIKVPEIMVLRVSVCAWSLGLSAVVSFVGNLMKAHR